MTSLGRAWVCGLACAVATLVWCGMADAQEQATSRSDGNQSRENVEVEVPSPLSPVVGRDLTLRLSMELVRPTWGVSPLYAPSYRVPRLVERRELFSVGGLSLTSEYEYAESTLEPSACFLSPCREMEYRRAAFALDLRLASFRMRGLGEVYDLVFAAEAAARTTDLGLEYIAFFGPRIRAKRDGASPQRSPAQYSALARVPVARPVPRPLFGFSGGF